MESSTHRKFVTIKNFILKLGTCDYVEEVTYYTIFDADRLSGGFSPNRWNITLLWLFFLSCPFCFLVPTPSSNRAADVHALWLKWRGSAQGRSFLGLGRWVTFWGKCAPKTLQRGAGIGVFKPKSQNTKSCILSKIPHRFQSYFAQW